MSNEAPMCYDRVLPRDAARMQRTRTISGRTRAIGLRGKRWPNGKTIRIFFMGGTFEQQALVKRVAVEWTEFANLNFQFVDDQPAEIRISFERGLGNWSYVGLDNEGVVEHAATMNLADVETHVILHEFGHMIGLGHEHQNPNGGIQWNDAVVIQVLSRAPNFWSEHKTRQNLLTRYRADQVNGTAFDPDSIMLYSYPDAWTQNMRATAKNLTLSDQDKAFISSNQMYPGRTYNPTDPSVVSPVSGEIVSDDGNPGPGLDEAATAVPTLTVNNVNNAEIFNQNEEDNFRFLVNDVRSYTIETHGNLDLIMSLFGPNNTTRLVATDDDGGSRTNSKITAVLEPGEYQVRVSHFSDVGTGAYQISVTA